MVKGDDGYLVCGIIQADYLNKKKKKKVIWALKEDMDEGGKLGC